MVTEHANLTAALAAVQAKLPKIPKSKTAIVPTKTGGSYTYRYADLAEVSAAVLPLLAAEGLAWTCLPEYADGRLLLRAELRHTGGEKLDAAWPLPTDGSPQLLGGALTYGRRYLLSAVVGVATDEDDDATGASGRHDTAAPRRRQRQPAPEPEPAEPGPAEPAWESGEVVGQRILQQLGIALAEYGLSEREARLTFVGGLVGREIESSKDLTDTEARYVLKTIRQQVAEDKASEKAAEPAGDAP